MIYRLFALALFITSLNAAAADWPCWRGPDGLGVSPETNLPAALKPQWKLATPGKGASSPIVVGNRVFITAQTDDSGLQVIAIDRESGQIVWAREIGRGKLPANNLHNMATPTAVAEGERVWALFGTGDLACLDHTGQVLWRRNLVKEFGPYKTNHGYGSSPMLLDGRLYITCMHQGPSYLLAIDAATGKDLWRKTRSLDPTDESQDSYSSPIFLRRGAKPEIILAGAEALNSYDPATGEELWIYRGIKVPHPFGRTIAGPAAGDGTVVAVASGFQSRGYTLALSPSGKGAGSGAKKLWSESKYSPDCPTPVVYQGKVFTINDDGIASCLDLKTGERHWQERLFHANGKVSPIAGDGKVYFTSGQANGVVVRSLPRLEVLATNEVNETTLSTPAISHGRIFLRTAQHLYSLGTK